MNESDEDDEFGWAKEILATSKRPVSLEFLKQISKTRSGNKQGSNFRFFDWKEDPIFVKRGPDWDFGNQDEDSDFGVIIRFNRRIEYRNSYWAKVIWFSQNGPSEYPMAVHENQYRIGPDEFDLYRVTLDSKIEFDPDIDY